MLLDTSGLLCIVDKAERHHRTATAAFSTMQYGLLHNYVVAEFVALADARGVPRQWALMFVAQTCIHPKVRFRWVDDQLHSSAMSLLFAQLDKSYSLCDAVSFVLMRQENVKEALTTDHHFEQAGFTRLLQ